MDASGALSEVARTINCRASTDLMLGSREFCLCLSARFKAALDSVAKLHGITDEELTGAVDAMEAVYPSRPQSQDPGFML